LAPIENEIVYRILLVDDDRILRELMTRGFERKGFDVVAAGSVTEALAYIASQSFDVLVTDLHMPNAGDGFTVVSAMRHSQPDALTMIVTGYPDVQSAMAAILLEADEIVVKPFELAGLTSIIQDRMSNRKSPKQLERERVTAILQRSVSNIVDDWLARAKQVGDLNRLELSDGERTEYLPTLVEDLCLRLSRSSDAKKDSDAAYSSTAFRHGTLRHQQGYTPEMMVEESRILQVTLFGTLQNNLGVLDFSLLLPDVMAIADEVDAQLTQSMVSYVEAMNKMES
jgi:DNA-binding response OmpR family regulator